MATVFNEDNTIEQMILSTLQENGWKYIPAEELPRMYSDVLVEQLPAGVGDSAKRAPLAP